MLINNKSSLPQTGRRHCKGQDSNLQSPSLMVYFSNVSKMWGISFKFRLIHNRLKVPCRDINSIYPWKGDCCTHSSASLYGHTWVLKIECCALGHVRYSFTAIVGIWCKDQSAIAAILHQKAIIYLYNTEKSWGQMSVSSNLSQISESVLQK